MMGMLREFAAFWRRPRNARYVILVLAAAYATMLCHWDVRHNAASREFVFTNYLRAKDWRSLVRNQTGALAAALVVWTLAGGVWSRRRRQPLEAGLARTALCFTPGLFATLGVATNVLGCDKDLAKAIEVLSVAAMVGWFWTEMDLWPLRAAGPEPRLPRFYARILVVAIAAYAAVFGWLSVARYQTFYAALHDLGLYTQQLWGNLHGHWFLVSHYGLRGDTMLAEHFMPLILLLTPFYAVWQDPRTILVLQAAAVALAALPLYGIVLRLGLDRRVGLFLAGSYLLHPLLQVATLYDFHPDAFVPLFALGSFWAFLTLDERLRERAVGEGDGRPFPWRLAVTYALFVLLWLSCKEDSIFGVAMVGLYAIAFRRRPLLGLATLAGGLVWGRLALHGIIPHFRGSPYSHIDRYYYLVAPFGWSPGQGSFFLAFVRVALFHPFHLLGQILDPPRILALLKLFGPVAFLSIFGPKELLIAMAAVLLSLFSNGYEQYEFRLHYPFAMLPFVYVAALVGVRNLAAWLARGDRAAAGAQPNGSAHGRPVPQLVLAALAFVAAAGLCRAFGEMPLTRPFGPEKVWRKPHHRLADKFLRAVPPDASLSAQTGLAAHATHRRAIFQFPELKRRADTSEADYILLDVQAPTWPLSRSDYMSHVTQILDGPNYGVVLFEDGYILLQRGHSSELNVAAREMLGRFD